MQNGTHAEAIEAGFTSKQAAFFTRACIDIKNECWQHFEQKLREKEIVRNEARNQTLMKLIPPLITFIVGTVIGLLFNTTVG